MLGRFDARVYRVWIRDAGGARLFLFLLPGDAVVLSAALALILGLIGYRSWWRQFPVAPAVPMISGSVIGTAIGVWFLASLSVAQFQLWIGISVVVASVALSRAEARERVASPTVSLAPACCLA